MPKLFHISVKCRFQMVIIKFVNDWKLCNCDNLNQSNYKEIINKNNKAVIHLYQNNIVSEDFCDLNIFIIKDKKRYHRILLDFS
jgi:RIO-like serine/threonine protein kinase